MGLSRIVMRLARNPGTEFAGGDDNRGYALTAPLTGDGHFDEAAYGEHRDQCLVRRFAPDEAAAEGRLARRGSLGQGRGSKAQGEECDGDGTHDG